MTYTTVQTFCVECGRMVTLEEPEYQVEKFKELGQNFPYCCPECEIVREERKRKREDEEFAEEKRREFAAHMEESGIPEEYRVLLPPVPAVAKWIEDNGNRNILLHGQTGAGKSTSAGYMGRIMISAGKRVKWFNLSVLLDAWREARRSDEPDAVERMFRHLEAFDVLILDECDKPINTDSTHECMFRLIEDVSNGTSRAKMWLFGNFYKGSIEAIFGNGEAARRRFNQCFACAQILTDGTIKKIRL